MNFERARGGSEWSLAHVPFSSFFSFPSPFLLLSHYHGSEHGESAFGKDDWKHKGEGKKGIISGRTRAIPAFARTSLDCRTTMRSCDDGPSDDPTLLPPRLSPTAAVIRSPRRKIPTRLVGYPSYEPSSVT